VVVIDWIEIGNPPPIITLPALTARLFLRTGGYFSSIYLLTFDLTGCNLRLLRLISTESWLALIWRIIGALVLAVLIVVGYFWIRDWRENHLQNEYHRYAGAITETSVAAELYRNKKDSFLVVRDSILRKYNVTPQEMLHFRDRFKDDPEEWAEFWKYVTDMTDSSVKVWLEELKKKPETTADSIKAKVQSDSI
jgi:hypothetical protein